MSALRPLIVMTCASVVLASCGLKGPLKLPPKASQTSTTTSPATTPAPVEDKKKKPQD